MNAVYFNARVQKEEWDWRPDRDLGKSIALVKRKQSVSPHNYSAVILTHPVRQSVFEEWLCLLCYWTALAYQRISPSPRFFKQEFLSRPLSSKHASVCFFFSNPNALESMQWISDGWKLHTVNQIKRGHKARSRMIQVATNTEREWEKTNLPQFFVSSVRWLLQITQLMIGFFQTSEYSWVSILRFARLCVFI